MHSIVNFTHIREHFYPLKSKLSFSTLVTSIALIAIGSCYLAGVIPHVGVYGAAFLAVGILVGSVSGYYQFNRCKTAPDRRAEAAQVQNLVNRLGSGRADLRDEVLDDTGRIPGQPLGQRELFQEEMRELAEALAIREGISGELILTPTSNGVSVTHNGLEIEPGIFQEFFCNLRRIATLQRIEIQIAPSSNREPNRGSLSFLECLHVDMMGDLASFLNPHDLANLSACSSVLNRSVYRHLWRNFKPKAHIPCHELLFLLCVHGHFIENLNLSRNLKHLSREEQSSLIRSVATLCPNLASLAFADCKINCADDLGALAASSFLKQMTFDHVQFQDSFNEGFSSLKVLNLDNCQIPEGFFRTLPSSLDRLKIDGERMNLSDDNHVSDLEDNLRHQSLISLQLGEGGFYCNRPSFLSALGSQSSLRELSLDKQLIIEGNEFFEILPGFSSLTSLELHALLRVENQVDWAGKIAQLTGLTHLNISTSNWSPEHLTVMLSPLTSLEYLNLMDIDITVDIDITAHFANLARALSQLKQLTYLNLSNTLLTASDVWLMKNEIAQLSYLRELNIRSNAIGPLGMQELVEALPVSLTALDLGQCELGDQGIIALSGHLNQFRSLTHLDLDSNRLQSEGMQSLATPLEELTSLVELNLSENKGVDRLFRSLSSLKSLRKLSLRDIFFDMSQGHEFAEVLGHLTSLEELNLGFRQTSHEDVAEVIITAFAGLTSLKQLEFIQLTSRGVECLSRVIPHLKALQSLKLYLDRTIGDRALALLAGSLAELLDFTELDNATMRQLDRVAQM